jgi:hypothetical protein
MNKEKIGDEIAGTRTATSDTKAKQGVQLLQSSHAHDAALVGRRSLGRVRRGQELQAVRSHAYTQVRPQRERSTNTFALPTQYAAPLRDDTQTCERKAQSAWCV